MLVIDAREACSPNPTGKALWTRHCIEELLTRGLDLRVLLHNASHPWALRKPVLHFQGMQRTGIGWHFAAAKAALRHGATYFSPTSYLVPAFAPHRLPCVTVVHDLIAFRSEPHALRPVLIERATLPRAARRSSLLCTVSESTRTDLLSQFPAATERCVAIGSGPVDDALPADGETRYPGAVLCIATLCPRKNQLRLLRAHASLPLALRERHPLVLVGGRGWHDEEIVRSARRTPFVHWLGYVDPSALGSLYSSAAALAYPSLYEGFGMPLLSAFQRGIPVLTSARGSLAEVAEDAAVIVDPLSSEAIAAGLHRLLTDEHLRMTLRAAGERRLQAYSWHRVVDRLLEALRAQGLYGR